MVRVEANCSLLCLNPPSFRICLPPEMQKSLGDKKGCRKMVSIVGLRRTNKVNWSLKEWFLVPWDDTLVWTLLLSLLDIVGSYQPFVLFISASVIARSGGPWCIGYLKRIYKQYTMCIICILNISIYIFFVIVVISMYIYIHFMIMFIFVKCVTKVQMHTTFWCPNSHMNKVFWNLQRRGPFKQNLAGCCLCSNRWTASTVTIMG